MVRLMPLLVPLAATLAAAAPAGAQDARDTLAHEALLESLKRSESAPRFAFIRTATVGTERVEARYDPFAAADQAWTLIYPTDPESLSDGARRFLDTQRAEPQSDRRLLFGFQVLDATENPEAHQDEPAAYGSVGIQLGRGSSLRLGIGDTLRLLHEDEAEAVYAFIPSETGSSIGLSDNVAGELTVAKTGPVVRNVRYYSREPFKPNLSTRIDHLDFTLSYVEIAPGGPVVMNLLTFELQGRAMFRPLDIQNHLIQSDFEILSPAD